MSLLSRLGRPAVRAAGVARSTTAIRSAAANLSRRNVPSQSTLMAKIHETSVAAFSSQFQADFKPKVPTEMNLDMARGIQNATLLILQHGVGKQRLELLSETDDEQGETSIGDFQMSPFVMKWQRMMEIYLGAQLHIIAGLGYPANEQGLMMYTQQLAGFVQSKASSEVQEELRLLGCGLWRNMLVVTFKLDAEELESQGELSIVDARNQAHKVSSRLVEPKILEEVMSRCAEVPSGASKEEEMGMKHFVIQDVVVDKVYLGSEDGKPSLVEELGYGTGPQGYASMQYKMAFYENDPLCAEYTASAMIKIWQAAGLDLGPNTGGAAVKMPLSLPGSG